MVVEWDLVQPTFVDPETEARPGDTHDFVKPASEGSEVKMLPKALTGSKTLLSPAKPKPNPQSVTSAYSVVQNPAKRLATLETDDVDSVRA